MQGADLFVRASSIASRIQPRLMILADVTDLVVAQWTTSSFSLFQDIYSNKYCAVYWLKYVFGREAASITSSLWQG